jgi:hypothetical protein
MAPGGGMKRNTPLSQGGLLGGALRALPALRSHGRRSARLQMGVNLQQPTTGPGALRRASLGRPTAGNHKRSASGLLWFPGGPPVICDLF